MVVTLCLFLLNRLWLASRTSRDKKVRWTNRTLSACSAYPASSCSPVEGVWSAQRKYPAEARETNSRQVLWPASCSSRRWESSLPRLSGVDGVVVYCRGVRSGATRHRLELEIPCLQSEMVAAQCSRVRALVAAVMVRQDATPVGQGRLWREEIH